MKLPTDISEIRVDLLAAGPERSLRLAYSEAGGSLALRSDPPGTELIRLGWGNELELDDTRRIVGFDLVVPRSAWLVEAAAEPWPPNPQPGTVGVDERTYRAGLVGRLVVPITVRFEPLITKVSVDFGRRAVGLTAIRLGDEVFANIADGRLVSMDARLADDDLPRR